MLRAWSLLQLLLDENFTFLWEQFSTASVTPKSRFSIQKDVMRASGKQFHCLLQSITVISLPQRSRYFIGRTTGSVYTFLVVYSPPQRVFFFDLAVIRIFFCQIIVRARPCIKITKQPCLWPYGYQLEIYAERKTKSYNLKRSSQNKNHHILPKLSGQNYSTPPIFLSTLKVSQVTALCVCVYHFCLPPQKKKIKLIKSLLIILRHRPVL